MDVPFEQNRVLILPPDPIPHMNPRPSHDITPPWQIGNIAGPTTPWNQGFTQYVLGDPAGGYGLAYYPTTKSAVLSQIAALTGIATPGGIIDRSVTIVAGATVTLMAANPARSYLLLYNPTQSMAWFNEGTATLGADGNLQTGPGNAWFMAHAQLLAPTYTGALTVTGLTGGTQFYAWEF
jgi:hypothetical protein